MVCVCLCVCSHLGFLLDFEELRHVREVFLVGLSHLFLCCLWVHDLQPLQMREEPLIKNQYLYSNFQTNQTAIQSALNVTELNVEY